MMTYTIGKKEEYDAGLEEQGAKFLKRGQGHYKGIEGLYKGGAVFSTRAEAQRYIDTHPAGTEGWAVYGLLADWEKHCVQHDGEPFRRLVIDRQIVRAD